MWTDGAERFDIEAEGAAAEPPVSERTPAAAPPLWDRNLAISRGCAAIWFPVSQFDFGGPSRTMAGRASRVAMPPQSTKPHQPRDLSLVSDNQNVARHPMEWKKMFPRRGPPPAFGIDSKARLLVDTIGAFHVQLLKPPPPKRRLRQSVARVAEARALDNAAAGR
jgi:hypothetical protein